MRFRIVSAFSALTLALVTATAFAQTEAPASANGAMDLSVIVTAKDGKPVPDLSRQDFTLLDNKAAAPITSFKAIDGTKAPIEVTILVDAVNTGYDVIAYEREELDKFLHANGGQLTYPTSMAVLTDNGLKAQQTFSKDGNALAAAIDGNEIGLRSIPRSTGIYGADERLQVSLQALHSLVARESSRPGRKLILWLSPGWPIISGPRVELSAKQQQGVFSEVVGFSNELRRANVTLYSIDPRGSNVSVGRSFYYQEFLKGVSKPSQTEIGDLALQVLAVQSGGLVLNFNNDVAALIQKAIADNRYYYEIGFAPVPGERAGEYHHIEVKVNQRDLTARTRDGYYSQP